VDPISIVIRAKSVYGEIKFYPVCQLAELFASVAGTKTLTLNALGKIEREGTFSIVEEVRGGTKVSWSVKSHRWEMENDLR